jgi:hypothetical protein
VADGVALAEVFDLDGVMSLMKGERRRKSLFELSTVVGEISSGDSAVCFAVIGADGTAALEQLLRDDIVGEGLRKLENVRISWT